MCESENRNVPIKRKAYDIILKGYNRGEVTKDECTYLLEMNENSIEASFARIMANSLVRESTQSTANMTAQLGVQIAPCEANCSFCNFNSEVTNVKSTSMSDEEIESRVRSYTEYNDVWRIFLMTMHRYDIDRLKETIKLCKKVAPKGVQIGLNIGDADIDSCLELRKAGAEVAYHVCRLREGEYTKLKPEDRIATMRNFKEAGFELATCIEPIGPETTVKEMIERFFLAKELECEPIGVMKRVAVPGTPMSSSGMISDSRLTQLAAVFALASSYYRKEPAINIHEPCQLGFFSGSRHLTAEYGANPRDAGLGERRGRTTAQCRKIFYDAGFEHIMCGDGKREKLNIDYLAKTGSV